MVGNIFARILCAELFKHARKAIPLEIYCLERFFCCLLVLLLYSFKVDFDGLRWLWLGQCGHQFPRNFTYMCEMCLWNAWKRYRGINLMALKFIGAGWWFFCISWTWRFDIGSKGFAEKVYSNSLKNSGEFDFTLWGIICAYIWCETLFYSGLSLLKSMIIRNRQNVSVSRKMIMERRT